MATEWQRRLGTMGPHPFLKSQLEKVSEKSVFNYIRNLKTSYRISLNNVRVHTSTKLAISKVQKFE